MNTKEKLELLWKYLLLLVLAVGLFRFSGKPHSKMMGKHFDLCKHEMSFYGDDDREIDVRVEKEIVNGDTVMNITINGKPVDVSMFEETNGKMKWVSEDGEVIVIKIDDDEDDKGKKDIRIIKKVIKIRDKN